MFFRRFFENRIKETIQYSLLKVSIVVFALMLVGCGATSEDGMAGNGGMMSADGAAGDGSEMSEDGASGDGSAVSEDGEAAADTVESNDSTMSEDGAGTDGSSLASNEEDVDDIEPYGPYEIELEKHYQWACDGENEELYLITNPNLNVALRGAWLDTDVSVTGGTTCVATTIVPIYLKAGDTLSFAAEPEMSRKYYLATLDRENCVYTCVYYTEWQDMEDETFTVTEDSYLVIDFSFANTSTDDRTDIDTSRQMTDAEITMLLSDIIVVRNSASEKYENLYADNDALLAEIEVTEGSSAEGNPYILIKIPSELSNGQQVMPELQQTSRMEYYAYPTYDKLTSEEARIIFRSVLSPMMFAEVYHTAFTINAGLFNIFSNTPQGQTIIDGMVVTNNPMKDDIGDPISLNTECYAMTIDSAGMMDFAKNENGAPYRTVDAYSLVDAGVCDAITGWGCIVYDGISVVELNPGSVDEYTIFYEQVHRRKVAHQVIGQDDAGNYYILSTNDVDSGYGYGLNYDEAADIMIAAGATFAYMLDGGDSVATVLDGVQLTTIYYENYGKPVPTVISFVAK